MPKNHFKYFKFSTVHSLFGTSKLAYYEQVDRAYIQFRTLIFVQESKNGKSIVVSAVHRLMVAKYKRRMERQRILELGPPSSCLLAIGGTIQVLFSIVLSGCLWHCLTSLKMYLI